MRMSYAEGLTSPEIEIAEGGTMLDNKSKFTDLKLMLDSNRENIKMDAMKRIINMVARGKDVSELFPAVVKNVAVKNLELKKLVYVFLVRYAEEQQDLALLSISTFQRALKDPNQLIRASALRVLSSIRVTMIAPVLLLAIKESVRDMSAYVRKVAAHAIPKLFVLDPELQPQLIECIDFLLADKRTLVLGSAVHAFEEICPDRFDLLHRHFRSLCRALADVDEWGQIVMIGLLTRYARTQFTTPGETDKPLDPDHNLLIMSTKPLLQSRNCAVVMAVAQLLYYIAPHSQLSIVPKSLVRLLRGSNEVQYVVLVNIATICASRNDMVNERIFAISKNLFEPFLKSFFVQSSDTSHVKQLKLQVLTSLVSENNVQLVIRELQAYLQMADLAGHAIEAIGRCALQVESASEICLTCLINLISSSRETIVCSAVVVLKRLLHADAPVPLLKRVVRLVDSVKAPTARACVIWLVETHMDKVGHLAPDLLRQLAKTFINESDCVKLQALNLAVRLWCTDRDKCELLIRYILKLARFDRSYDIRDRCRFIRNFFFNRDREESIRTDCRIPIEIFLSPKPAPTLHSQFSDREHFQLGTLSHLLNQRCAGYTELPDFPEQAPDPTIRRSTHPLGVDEIAQEAKVDREEESDFYSDEEDEDEEEGEDEEEDEAVDEEDSGEEVDEDESSEEEEEEKLEENGHSKKVQQLTTSSSNSSKGSTPKLAHKNENKKVNKSDKVATIECVKISSKKLPANTEPQKSNMELLLDLDFSSSHSTTAVYSNYIRASAQYSTDKYFGVLSSLKSGGLSIEGRFPRSPSLFSNSMVCVELLICFKCAGISETNLSILEAEPILSMPTSGPINLYGLKAGERRIATLGIDFCDSGCASEWKVNWSHQAAQFDIQLRAPFGEQIEAIDLPEDEFNHQRKLLSGMNKTKCELNALDSSKPFPVRELYKIANCKQVPGKKWQFVAQTISQKNILLVIVSQEIEHESVYELTVCCENFTFASLLAKEIQNAFNNTK